MTRDDAFEVPRRYSLGISFHCSMPVKLEIEPHGK